MGRALRLEGDDLASITCLAEEGAELSSVGTNIQHSFYFVELQELNQPGFFVG